MTPLSTPAAQGTVADDDPSRYVHPDAPVWLLPGDRIIWSQGYRAGVEAQLAEIEAMLSDGQGDDDGPQILPDFEEGWSTVAKVEACLFLLEKRRDLIDAHDKASPSPEALPASGVEDLKAAWSFLQDRLLEFEQEIGSGEEEREWAGHVMPALSRFGSLIAALTSAPAPEDRT